MNKKMKKIFKIIIMICIIILIIDGVYFLYKKNTIKDEKIYFDGVNAFSYFDKDYITVGSNNDNDKGYEKAKVVKYNQKKEKVWEKIYNHGYNSTFFGVKDDGKDIVAVGSYEYNKKEHKNSLRRGLIVKYDENGEVLFEKDFKVLDNSKFVNLYVVDDGYIVVGQSIYDNMTLGLSEDGGAFIIKYSKEGKVLWTMNYGGAKSGIYNDVICYDGYIYTTGKNYARVGVVSKYDLDGSFIKNVTYQYTDSLGFTGINVVDGKLVVVGAKKTKEDESDYDTDSLIVEYDLDCNYIKESIYTGSGMERFNQVVVDENNNLITVGQSAIYDSKKSTNKENIFKYDGLIGKYKSNLDEINVVEYGVDNDMDDYFTNIKLVDGNYLVSGYSSYKNDGYLSKFITYSDALKVLEVK